MSKTITNINNSVYDFDLSLVSTTKGSELILPIPKGAVEYLEIEDNLANFGVIGKCRIANFYGILEQLNVFDVKSMNCIYVRITNTDFSAVNKVDTNNTICFMALLKQSVDSSTNMVDKSINFTFEEYFIARTRVESIDETFQPTEGSPSALIKALFEFSNSEAVTSTKLSSLWPGVEKDFFNLSTEPGNLRITDFYEIDSVKSIYDLIQECYKYVTYSTGPGLLTTTNIEDGGVIRRKVTLLPLSDYTADFYDKYQENAEDLSKYVTEEFIIGNDSRVNTLNTNFIDAYNILRADQTDLLSNKWINYIVTEHAADISISSTVPILYSDVKIDFCTEMLKGLNANLPERSTSEKVAIKRVHKKISSPDFTARYVQNALKKSFVFDNAAITFAVQGNTYRQPGKFIKLQLNTAELVKKKGSDSKAVDGYWFITGLKHIFKGDFYTNEYACVKLHGDGKSLASSSNSNVPFANILGSGGSDVVSAATALFDRDSSTNTSTEASDPNPVTIGEPVFNDLPPIEEGEGVLPQLNGDSIETGERFPGIETSS